MRFEVNGVETYAYTGAREPRDGQPWLLFVHGGGLDHTVWIMQSRYLAHHGYNVLAVDLPGHGRSAGEPLPDIGAMASWCAAAMDAVGAERVAAIGHSMGSLVALELGANHPERTWHLGLLGVSVPMPVTDMLLDAAGADLHDAFDMVNLWGHAMRSQVGGSQSPGMWMTGGSVRLLERARPGVLHNDLSACNAYAVGLDAADRVRCPVHVLLGSADVMASPRAAKELISRLADVHVTTLPGCGHMLMSERPNEVLDALRESLGRAAPGG